MKLHILKIGGAHLKLVRSGKKKAEIRLNDRDYKVDDWINFKEGDREWGPYKITHVLNFPEGLKEGYVCLSIEPLKYVPSHA